MPGALKVPEEGFLQKPETGNENFCMKHVCRKTGNCMKPFLIHRSVSSGKITFSAHNHEKSTFSTQSVLVLV
jgi:hypothetical protein